MVGGETHSFADSFHAAYDIRHNLQKLSNLNILLQIVTDSDSLFKFIIQCSHSIERELMIDVRAEHEAFEDRKIDNVGSINSDGNLADYINDVNKPDLLQHVMGTTKLTRFSKKCIIRPPADNSNSALIHSFSSIGGKIALPVK